VGRLSRRPPSRAQQQQSAFSRSGSSGSATLLARRPDLDLAVRAIALPTLRRLFVRDNHLQQPRAATLAIRQAAVATPVPVTRKLGHRGEIELQTKRHNEVAAERETRLDKMCNRIGH
jgi:hypothetical protein